jgi:16S rRNA (cytidine1402-2'-O)-methyltransferase
MFFVVATPIGNLEDISFRAIKTLKEVDLILAEDTRQTKKILNHYEIKNKTLWSYNTRSSDKSIESILEYLKTNKKVALVSDAGTPCISDPGVKLISKLRENNIKISSIPGASAFITALSGSGFPSNKFEFLGFLPHKKGRQTILKNIAKSNHTVIFYESVHRIHKCITQMQEFFPEKKICIARELTKIYEEFIIGSPLEILNIIEKNPEKIKGEFVVIVKQFTKT